MIDDCNHNVTGCSLSRTRTTPTVSLFVTTALAASGGPKSRTSIAVLRVAPLRMTTREQCDSGSDSAAEASVSNAILPQKDTSILSTQPACLLEGDSVILTLF